MSLLGCVCLFLFLVATIVAEEEPPDFFMSCSGGKVDEVKSALEEHPEWSTITTEEGESCLHLAAIPGSSELTALLLENGADPNVRTTFSGGLRMNPLSWNVYGGHLESVKILLKHGADVNADFDLSQNAESPVTVLDIILKLLEGSDESDPNSNSFRMTRDFLLENGAKTYEQLKVEAKEL